jgi:hypothetical protein
MRIALLFMTIVILLSCSDGVKGFKEPEDLIPRDTMVMILKDLTLIEAHVQNKFNSVDQYRETMLLSGNNIIEKYSVTRSRLDRSMDYYGSRQEVLAGIYSEILDSLNREATIYSPERSVKNDSVSGVGTAAGRPPVLGRPGL